MLLCCCIITTTFVVTVYRIAQGMSFIEEVVGAEFYLAEITKILQHYWVVASLVVFVMLGATVALVV